MQYLIKAALENAGVNPTRDSFADAMRGLSGPQAFRSNGEGAFGQKELPTQMQAVKFTLASRSTPKGADGTYNGCPAR